MRALVTGGTGFVGSELVSRLLKDGAEVHVLVRDPSKVAFRLRDAKSVECHLADPSYGSIDAAVLKSRPDVVFHLASFFLAQHRPDQIAALVNSNILMGAHLLEAMARYSVERLVVAGTSWQNYRNAEYDPVCLYAATKQAFEALLQYWLNAKGLRAIVLKLFDTYGPADPRGKLLSILCHLRETGEEVALSRGEQLLDLVHVRDAVEAFVVAGMRTACLGPGVKETFAVSSGAVVTLKDVVALFEEVAETRLPILWGERSYREREVMEPWSGGLPPPGWSPKITLRAGIEELLRGPVRQ